MGSVTVKVEIQPARSYTNAHGRHHNVKEKKGEEQNYGDEVFGINPTLHKSTKLNITFN